MNGLPEAAPHLANARDLADAAPGLRHGVAFRSDAPQDGDEPPAGLSPWPPATVLDLRGADEKGQPNSLAATSRVVDLDILADANLAGDAAQTSLSSLAALYSTMIEGVPASGLTRVVAEVARDEAPVLYHCSAGKDRTGVSSALILRLLGYDRDVVVADYTATAANMMGVIARIVRGLPEALTAAGGSPLSAVPREILDAPASAIESVLDAWDAHEGGTLGWYLANGGDEVTLVALRERLVA
ncbi:tyrosine-protein phosphatase [Demequina oxidasica]|uniref:tyrosine-protein phosphatase n=1 Tax=Demequina oxidasica TaxID=676199 RepID=UPI000784EBBA|nr:tyrosine-protein phosphatase [Demequina oxidasica]